MIKKLFTLFSFWTILVLPVMAQTSDNSIADTLMGSNKLIAVIAVICIILIGIVAFLFSQESRIRKLEEEVKQKSQ